jgi:ribosomal subunit interface protein
MDIITSARHFDLTDALKQTINYEANNLHHDQLLTSVEVVLIQEHGKNEAEVIFHIKYNKGVNIHVRSEKDDMYEAISTAFSVAQKQLDKRFDIITDHHKESLNGNEMLLG